MTIRHAVRQYARQPGTTMLAVLSLSLGIGANAVIFSFLHAVLLRPLPFPDAGRLVAIVDRFQADGLTNMAPTVPEMLDVRRSSTHLAGISFYDMRDVQTTGGSEPARAFAARVEASFLGILGVRPALGRLFVDGEGTPGRDPVVILTDGFWRRNFGADPSVIGRSLVVNGVPNTVVGVLPADFSFDYHSAETIELYVPFPLDDDYTLRTSQYTSVRRVTAIGRLKDGSSIEQAGAEVQAISRSIATEHPSLYRRGSDGQDLGFAMQVVPIRDILMGSSRAIVLLLFGAVVLVLLIACLNTAQFLLARAFERQPEVAVRRALGASRARLIRQFLTEALLLSAAATVVGLLQARWLMDVFRAMFAERNPFVAAISINTPLVLFTVALVLVVTVGFGLLPALHFARPATAGMLHARTTGPVRNRTRQLLIALEVAISIMLLVTAGLLAQGIWKLQNAPTGFNTQDVTVLRMRVAARGVTGASGLAYRRYLQQVITVPGVASAAVADRPVPGFPGTEFSIVGRADDAATVTRHRASWRIVSPDYFSMLRIPLLAGRVFTDDDGSGRPPVAIVNEEMARRYWPGQSPLGHQLHSGAGPRASTATIVGVVGDVRSPARREIDPQIYVSYLQQSEPNITLLVRTAAGAPVPIDGIKQAIRSIVPEQPLFDIRPLSDVVTQSLAGPRVIARLLGTFAFLALLMSTLGVYTVVSYVTSRRTREVALRRAVGAQAGDVLRLLAAPTIRWTLVGVVAGTAGALAINNTLRAIVAGVAQVDLPAAAAIAALYLVIVAVAVCAPAARALRIDPAVILRAE